MCSLTPRTLIAKAIYTQLLFTNTKSFYTHSIPQIPAMLTQYSLSLEHDNSI